MEFLTNIINAITSLPADFWATVGAYLGGSTVIAAILQITKYKFNFKDAKKFVIFLMGSLSFVASLVEFLVQSGAGALAGNIGVIGSTTAQLMAGAVVMHRFFVSPAYYRITKGVNNFSDWLDKVSAFQAAQKANTVSTPKPAAVAQASAILPAEGDLKQFEL